jgi:Domain of unknown function (DUF5655)/Domain of unknown function (DUF4287)
MGTVETAIATQLANIEKRTGQSLAELVKIAKASGFSKHGEIRDHLKATLGIGFGDANALAHYAAKSAAPSSAKAADSDDIVAALYLGPKAALRPIHDALMAKINAFGAFEISPKKTYVSLRRKKQFAMLGPATNTRVELGLNIKSLPANDRLVEQAAGGMCNYKVKLTDVGEVNADLVKWVQAAFDAAG